MPIHRVLSSACSMRLTAPGIPSLIETGFGEPLVEGTTVLLVRFNTVMNPPKNPSGIWCCPTTYIVEVVTRALLAPPGIGMLMMATAWVFAQGAALHGSNPDCWPSGKIIGATGNRDIAALVPPHSGPQFSTYAVLPSAEKTAFTGRSKTSGAP